MIVGLGIDVVEIARFEEVLQRHPERAPERIFTTAERAEGESRARPLEYYAGRFAAKEALLKAIGTGLTEGISWQDITIGGSAGSRPAVAVSGATRHALARLGSPSIHVSISHDGGVAIAVAILETAADDHRS